MENIPPTDVVGLGLNAMDTICVLPRFPQPNSKTHLREIRVEPGGQVATAMATCVKLGLKARYIGSVGTDDWGKAQLTSLRAAGLDVHAREVEGATSQAAVILLEEGVGERTILWCHDPRLNYPAGELRREMILGGRILHLDGCDSEAALQAARWAKEAGMPVVIDIDEVYDDSTHELLGLRKNRAAGVLHDFKIAPFASMKRGIAILSKISYLAVMKGITIKLPEETLRQLREEARLTGRSVAAVIRERVETPADRRAGSFHELASDLAGSLAGARKAATNGRRRFRRA